LEELTPVIVGLSSYSESYIKEQLASAGFTDGYFEAPITNENVMNDILPKLKERQEKIKSLF